MVSLLYHIKLKYTFFVKNVLAKNTVLKSFLFDYGNLFKFFFFGLWIPVVTVLMQTGILHY